MENYEAFVGFDLCKTPLSSIAQKIMSAMRSGDLVDSNNGGDNTNSKYFLWNCYLAFQLMLKLRIENEIHV